MGEGGKDRSEGGFWKGRHVLAAHEIIVSNGHPAKNGT